MLSPKIEIETEMNIKYFVIKFDDANKHLDNSQMRYLGAVQQDIENGRLREGKTKGNNYIVINQDEPYISEIIEILKRNGQWD